MGRFDFFRKKKSEKKPAPGKQDSRPRGRENPFEKEAQQKKAAKSKRENRFLKWWGGLKRRQRVLVVLGAVGIGLGSWFGAQWYYAPPPSHPLSTAVDPVGSGEISPIGGDYLEGTQVTLTATPAPGYGFVSWVGDAAGSSPTVTITMDSGKIVMARFRLIEHRLTTAASPAQGGSVSPGDGDYIQGSSVELRAIPALGYEFVAWSGDAAGESPATTITMDSDKSAVANFQIAEYLLSTTVSPAEGGEISPTGGLYDNGSSVILIATPAPGYEFIGWSGDAAGQNPTVTVTMDAAKSVAAEFERIRQLLTYTMEAGLSGSVVTYTGELERGDFVEGFVELTGVWYSYDRTFRWTFEIIGPEGRKVYYWYRGHWVKRNHRDFSFTAPLTGSYKIKVAHTSLYDKELVIEIIPKVWTLKSPLPDS
jgi:uncharacterized repeat protein (TIGR02543 family)